MEIVKEGDPEKSIIGKGVTWDNRKKIYIREGNIGPIGGEK